MLPYDIAAHFDILPVSLVRENDTATALIIIVPAGSPADATSAARFHTGCEIIAEEVPRTDLRRAIFAAYRGGAEALAEQLSALPDEPPPVVTPLDSTADNGIPAVLSSVLARAVTLSASDVHLEPFADGLHLRFRVNGLLEESRDFRLGGQLASQLARRVKILAGLEITGTGRILEGSFTLDNQGASYRIRVSVVPQIHGEKIVLRLLDEASPFWNSLPRGLDRFTALGLTRDQAASLHRYLGLDSGSILVAGPTGSGKTSLLYAILDILNTPWRNIVTIEDPVERTMRGVNQLELPRSSTYAELLPALLRQDPDIVMIGEIRERETARMALNAGLTGHLMLSTLHGANVIEALLRLRHLVDDVALLTTSVKLIVAGRLIPTNCPHCTVRAPPSPDLARFLQLSPDATVVAASGCEQCNHFGHAGRVGAFELLGITDSVRRSLQRKSGRTELLRAAAAAGYRPFAHVVRELLQRGSVAPSHALRALGVGVVPDN